MTIKTHNLQNETKAYKTCNYIYTMNFSFYRTFSQRHAFVILLFFLFLQRKRALRLCLTVPLRNKELRLSKCCPSESLYPESTWAWCLMPGTMPVITNHAVVQLGLLRHTEAAFFSRLSVKNLYSAERNSKGCGMKMELKNGYKSN
jgi:hypothetical protein